MWILIKLVLKHFFQLNFNSDNSNEFWTQLGNFSVKIIITIRKFDKSKFNY